MWLINTRTLQLEFFVNPEDVKYAILSHTWEYDEVTFQELTQSFDAAKKKAGFQKIQKTCEMARDRKLDYAWVDTCCIDKTSSAELSEAINSMFLWYSLSSVCFAFLSDLEPFKTQVGFGNPLLDKCKWFTRGWTLQELIAPLEVIFYDCTWAEVGTKQSLRPQLSIITGIDIPILGRFKELSEVPVGTRMSWAANRQTTRVEDLAYCLLGIFDINMPMLYGEGKKAFTRLQLEIAKDTNDLSLFAWTATDKTTEDDEAFRGILARSPAEFACCSKLRLHWDTLPSETDFTMTNAGLRIESALTGRKSKGEMEYILNLGYQDWNHGEPGANTVGIALTKTLQGFVRSHPRSLIYQHNKPIQRDSLTASACSDPAFYHDGATLLTILKDVDAPKSRKLISALDDVVYVRLKMNEPNPRNYHWATPRPMPESHWDSANMKFYLRRVGLGTYYVSFTLKPGFSSAPEPAMESLDLLLVIGVSSNFAGGLLNNKSGPKSWAALIGRGHKLRPAIFEAIGSKRSSTSIVDTLDSLILPIASNPNALPHITTQSSESRTLKYAWDMLEGRIEVSLTFDEGMDDTESPRKRQVSVNFNIISSEQ
jgi:hypothetical protein